MSGPVKLSPRDEYHDIAADLSFYLDDGEGDTMTEEQKEWLTTHFRLLDEAVSAWVRSLGGTP